MKKILSLLFLCLFFCKTGIAQTNTLKSLKIGDTVPDIEIKNIINFRSQSAKISDFRGKLLILDFWATWCQPCVAMMPKTDSLQKQFVDKVQFLPVTYEDKAVVEKFLNNMNSIIHVLPPSVTNANRILNNILFQHNSVPTYAWISPSGVLIAMTEPGEVTADNIRKQLSHQSNGLKSIILRPTVIDQHDPLFGLSTPVTDGERIKTISVDPGNIVYSSILTRANLNIDGGFASQSSNRITCKFNSIEGLYNGAIGAFRWEFAYNTRYLVDVKDSSLRHLILGQDKRGNPLAGEDAYTKSVSFDYELIVPSNLSGQRFEIMKDELNRYFGKVYHIEGQMEKIKIKCYRLIRTEPKIDRVYSKTLSKLNTSTEIHSATYGGLHYQHDSFSKFVTQLEGSVRNLPLIDETGFNEWIDMDINCSLTDMGALRKELQKYGMDLVKGESEVAMVVIKDKSDN